MFGDILVWRLRIGLNLLDVDGEGEAIALQCSEVDMSLGARDTGNGVLPHADVMYQVPCDHTEDVNDTIVYPSHRPNPHVVFAQTDTGCPG